MKVRGTASHVAEKYLQLARDSQSSGDPVAAENYYQHAEHYLRLIAAAHEQFRQNNPNYRESEQREPSFGEDGDEQPTMGANDGGYAPREPQQQQQQQPYAGQPYVPREPREPFRPREQRFPPRDQPQPYIERPQPASAAPAEGVSDVVGQLPAFVTGGGQPPAAPHAANGPNGFEGGTDRFPLHRRRRRRHGPRPEGAAEEGDSAPVPPVAE